MAKTAPKKTAAKRPEFPLLDRLDELMAELHEHVPAALEKFDAEAIHAGRVATRRLAAALDLMRPVLSSRHRKPLAGGLRKLRRTLGPLRDADVMLDHLADLRKVPAVAPAAGRLHDRLSADRRRLHDETSADVSVKRELRRLAAWPLVRHEIAEAREAVDCLLAESLHLQADAFAEQADRLVADHATGSPDRAGGRGAGKGESGGKGARKRSEVARGELKPAAGNVRTGEEVAGDFAVGVGAVAPRQNPHELRIAGKALRYTLEMADAEGRSPGKAVVKTFKRMQELLGDWHDQVVLVDRSLQEVIAGELAHFDAAAAEQVVALATTALRKSTRDLSGFAKLWAEKGGKIAGKIRSAFPLTRPFDPSNAAAAAAPVEAKPAGGAAHEKVPEGTDDGSTADADVSATDSAADGEAEGAIESETGRGPSGSAGREGSVAGRPTATPAA